MFRLPTAGHSARNLIGDLSTLAETLNPVNAVKLPAVWQARRSAEDYFATEKAARRICFVILRADTCERWLISFGPRGGWRMEWNFGNGAAA
jgi:hypothetical protein